MEKICIMKSASGGNMCNEIPFVRNSAGETTPFSIDRYVRDAVGRGRQYESALAEARSLLDNIRSLGLKEVETYAINRAVIENDPLLLCRKPTAEVRIRVPSNYLSPTLRILDYQIETDEPVAEAFTRPFVLDASFNFGISERSYVKVGDVSFDPTPALRFEAINLVLTSAGIGPFLAEGLLALNMLGDIDVDALLGESKGLSFEEMQQRIGEKQSMLNLVVSELNRLFKELVLQGFGPAALIEVVRRKFGQPLADDVARRAAEKCGFGSAKEAAKKAGSQRFFTALLKTLKGANLLLLLIELGLIVRAVFNYLDMYNKSNTLFAALFKEHEILDDPSTLISPGERTEVGGAIGSIENGCEAFIEYITTYLDDDGDLQMEVLSGPTKVTPGVVHREDITVPRRGSFQFFIVQFRVKCPGQDDVVIVVIRQAVRRQSGE